MRTSPARKIAPPRFIPARPQKRGASLRWLRWSVILGVWGGLAAAVVVLVLLWDLPRPEDALLHTRRPITTLAAADGRVFATSGDLYGEVLRLSAMPAHLPAAFLAVEDRRFRQHFGLDVIGLLRAAWANLAEGRVVQGGSTLTQQLAKNLFLTPERSMRRKGQEALLALWLESRFSKDQLLEIYLNRVYLGGGAYGVDAAARLYFGVPARRLAPWQSAMLAGLPKAPSRLNPRANPDAAIARALEVLRDMVETGALTAAEARLAQEQIDLPSASGRDTGWFADWVQDDLAERFPGNADLTLRTTLDLRLQGIAEQRLEAMLAGPGAAARVGQAAFLAMDATTGAVRVMVGGRSYARSPFNRAVQARRQPGSAFKPVVFLAALERGLGPDDTVSDGALRGRWSPGNGGWRSHGAISLEDALAHSVNTAAVRVLAAGGGARVAAAVAARLGLPGPFPNDATMALGTGEASLMELTGMIAAICNGGMQAPAFGIASAEAGRRSLTLARPGAERAMAPEHAASLRRMLAAAVDHGTGRAAAITGGETIGKTGTTQGFRDAWFIGCSRGLAAGVWMGNDDATPMEGVTGGALPARLFRDVMENAR
ncbi:transglycosylase domain-containing protein [Humitalea rosea]|uniref:transglycosylase domain-containing protein n=1 Tax=Humitalea rosea TaxID=990373 RepID=UPI001FE828FB|nr:transglycosylase domain-containing protein [Humitalea rosea]